MRTVAVGTGSPGSAYLLHPEAEATGGAIFHHAFCVPGDVAGIVAERLGPPPVAEGYAVEPLVARVRYAADALSKVLQPRLQPELAYFWCTIPDALCHQWGVGSAEALEGLRAVDGVFGSLVRSLGDATGQPVNVLVTSDHGYVTIEQHVDVTGFCADAELLQRFAPGEVSVQVDGGTGFVFLSGNATAHREEIAALFAEQEWVSAVLVSGERGRFLSLSTAGIAGPRAADVAFCFRWSESQNSAGVAGSSLGGGGIAVGAGDHGGGSPFEMHNTLLAAGPAFIPGEYDLSVGIVDVAPTICAAFGVAAPAAWTGRALHEALASCSRKHAPVFEAQTVRVTAGQRVFGMTTERVERTRYLCEISGVTPMLQ
jgi:hypothetical protein